MQMKRSKAIAIFLVLLVLAPTLAAATSIRDSLMKLSDSELLQLQQYLADELERRGLLSPQEDALWSTKTMGEELVWIPKSGTKYHDTSSCSNMKDPTQVSLDVAKELGYTPCKKCDPPKQ